MPSVDFKQLLEGYRKGTLNKEQLSRFEQLLHDKESEGALHQLLDESLQRILPVYAEETQEYLYERIKEQYIQQDIQPVQAAHRIHFLKTAWTRYAAAVLIIAVTIAAFLIFNQRRHHTEIAGSDNPLQTDIGPGGERAVLILADGSRIVLDSAANGNLAQEGSAAVVKLANGQIAYRAKGTTDGPLWNTMSTPAGGQYRVILSDGTGVWLNAASSITFPTAFTGDKREVNIQGEVYFEVAVNKQQPFVVNVDGRSQIEVLGTSFNINSYKDEGYIKTTLLEGSVKVIRSISTPVSSVILKPGFQAVMASSSEQKTVSGNNGIEVHAADTGQALAWKNGLFNFNGMDLRAIMRQLERWYGIVVKYEGMVPNTIYDGEMYRNSHLSDVLDMFKKMGVPFKLDGKTLIIME